MSEERRGPPTQGASIFGLGPVTALKRENEINLVRHLARIAAERDEAQRITGRPLETNETRKDAHDN